MQLNTFHIFITFMGNLIHGSYSILKTICFKNLSDVALVPIVETVEGGG